MIEFWIAFTVTTIILLAINYGKKHSKKAQPKNIPNAKLTKYYCVPRIIISSSFNGSFGFCAFNRLLCSASALAIS